MLTMEFTNNYHSFFFLILDTVICQFSDIRDIYLQVDQIAQIPFMLIFKTQNDQ